MLKTLVIAMLVIAGLDAGDLAARRAAGLAELGMSPAHIATILTNERYRINDTEWTSADVEKLLAGETDPQTVTRTTASAPPKHTEAAKPPTLSVRRPDWDFDIGFAMPGGIHGCVERHLPLRFSVEGCLGSVLLTSATGLYVKHGILIKSRSFEGGHAEWTLGPALGVSTGYVFTFDFLFSYVGPDLHASLQYVKWTATSGFTFQVDAGLVLGADWPELLDEDTTARFAPYPIIRLGAGWAF